MTAIIRTAVPSQTTSLELKLHAEGGPTPGLMVIGSPVALREFAFNLLEQVEQPISQPVAGSPRHLLTLKATSPYRDAPGYAVSFHREDEPLAAHYLVRRRHAPQPAVCAVILALGLVGAVLLLRWVAHAA